MPSLRPLALFLPALLMLSAPAQAAPNACQAVVVVPATGGTFTGVTSGSSTNAAVGSCPGTGTAPERVYRWAPTSSGQAEFSTCGTSTNFDSVLYVRSATCTGTQLTCNDDGPCATANSVDQGSRILLNVVSGQTYFIFVDGYLGARGNYALTIRPPARCGDGVRQGSEQCDLADASACASGQCASNCTCVPVAARCGDGVRQGSEQCDGADVAACTSGLCAADCTCVTILCGDGVRQGSEQCDGQDAATCTSGRCATNCTCVPVQCGDGVRQGAEQCDGQDVANCPSGRCASDCTCIVTQCGDGIRQGSEQCDLSDAANCASHQCYPNCTCIPPSAGRPDLVPEIVTPYFELGTSVPQGDVTEGCASRTTGIDLFRFGVRVYNLGRADLFLGDPLCPDCATHPDEVCGNPLFICAPAGGHNHGHYENYAAYDLLSSTGAVVVSGHKQGFCLHDGFDSGVPCPNRHFSSCDYQGLSIGCADLYEASLGCQYVDVTGLPPGPYTLRITVDPLQQIPEDNEVNNVITMPVTVPDRNCGATDIPAAGGRFDGVTSGPNQFGATCGYNASGPEKIYRWVPARSGTAVVNTCGTGTNFDTLLHVRRGSCISEDIVCNDDAPCATANSADQASRVTFYVDAGVPYFIFVDGYAGGAGRYSLQVTPP